MFFLFEFSKYDYKKLYEKKQGCSPLNYDSLNARIEQQFDCCDEYSIDTTTFD